MSRSANEWFVWAIVLAALSITAWLVILGGCTVRGDWVMVKLEHTPSAQADEATITIEEPTDGDPDAILEVP